MSSVVRTSGIVEDTPPNKTQSTQEAQEDTYNSFWDPQYKLDNFLKKNLHALGVAQIMIGLKCFLFGIIGSLLLLSSDFRDIFLCFRIGYPFWAAMSFITSGTLTVLSTMKYTKFVIGLNIGTNIVSSVLSSSGIILLSKNLFDVLFYECSSSPECLLAKPFTTSILIFQMTLTCVQTAISFSLSGLTYNVDGTAISWASVLKCLTTSDSEGPYQDLLTQPAVYEDLPLQDIPSLVCDP